MNRLLLSILNRPLPRRHHPYEAKPRGRLAALPRHPLTSRTRPAGMGAGTLPLLPRAGIPPPLRRRQRRIVVALVPVRPRRQRDKRRAAAASVDHGASASSCGRDGARVPGIAGKSACRPVTAAASVLPRTPGAGERAAAVCPAHSRAGCAARRRWRPSGGRSGERAA